MGLLGLRLRCREVDIGLRVLRTILKLYYVNLIFRRKTLPTVVWLQVLWGNWQQIRCIVSEKFLNFTDERGENVFVQQNSSEMTILSLSNRCSG